MTRSRPESRTIYKKKGEGSTDQYAILANRLRSYVERARAQRKQELIRERMQLALERTHSVVFEIESDTGVVNRHGYFEHFLDLQPTVVPTWQNYLEQVVHPDDREEFRQFYQQLLTGERDSGELEYRVSPESGNIRWIQENVHTKETDSRHTLGIAQDITTQKEQEEKRKQLIERVTDAIVEVDADWTFTLVNEQAEHRLAYCPPECSPWRGSRPRRFDPPLIPRHGFRCSLEETREE